MYYQINGSTGAILKKVDVSPHRPYGGIVDKNGLLWSADLSGNVLRLNTTTGAFSQIQLSGSQAYGMGLNRDGRLYVSGWCSNKLMMINTSTGAVAWTKDTGDSCSRGVAVTNDGDVWVANSGSNTVSRWSADGTKKETIKGFQHPTGVATDANGKVWVVDYNSSNIYRINPASNAVELTKAVAGPHYGYSDMTGIVSRSMTTKTGTWTVTLDSQGDTTAWDSLLWAGNVPQGSSLKVRVRSSKDNVTWSAWEDVLAATSMKATPAARYLQMEATLQLSAGEVSPILYDLMVKTK
jgi:streptogramin lyase